MSKERMNPNFDLESCLRNKVNEAKRYLEDKHKRQKDESCEESSYAESFIYYFQDVETLLDLYQKEKEKNKFINEIKTIETDDTIQVVLTKSQYSFLLNKSLNSVSKDKIKAKINQLKKEWYDFTVKNDVNDITMKINTEKLVDIESILNELLED